MKKAIPLVFCFCLILSLATTAFASYNIDDYIGEYSAYIPEPLPEDYGGVTPEFMEAHDAWIAGLNAFAEDREKAKPQPAAEELPPEPVSIIPIGSADLNHVDSSNPVNTPADTGADDKYPVGSWIDPAGNVYSPSGELLSPGTTPAMEPDPDSVKMDSLSSDELVSQADLSDITDPDVLSVIAGFVSDIASEPAVWYVEDLRPVDPPAEVLTGLKSMVISIFGEYTPVTTTSVISETVGNDTHQYLVETVASGAAGVDYEWIAGVALFGIMLFCLMKLLGGVIK